MIFTVLMSMARYLSSGLNLRMENFISTAGNAVKYTKSLLVKVAGLLLSRIKCDLTQTAAIDSMRVQK